MPYFTVALARRDSRWHVVDVDVDSADTVEDLVDLYATEAPDADPGLVLVEREDEWFALLRVSPDTGETRAFMSDPAGAEDSRYAELLGAGGDGGEGEPDLLADLGLPADELSRLGSDEATTPAEALAAVGEALGFADLLDSLR